MNDLLSDLIRATAVTFCAMALAFIACEAVGQEAEGQVVYDGPDVVYLPVLEIVVDDPSPPRVDGPLKDGKAGSVTPAGFQLRERVAKVPEFQKAEPHR